MNPPNARLPNRPASLVGLRPASYGVNRQFVQPHRLLAGLGMQAGAGQSAPLHLVQKAVHPLGMAFGRPDQAVASPFFSRTAKPD